MKRGSGIGKREKEKKHHIPVLSYPTLSDGATLITGFLSTPSYLQHINTPTPPDNHRKVSTAVICVSAHSFHSLAPIVGQTDTQS